MTAPWPDDSGHWYILKDKVPVPCAGLLAYAAWAAANERQRIVGHDEIDGVMTSTVFLGFNHRFQDRERLPPVLFETMVLGGKYDGLRIRTCTWHEAEEAHTDAWDVVAGVHA